MQSSSRSEVLAEINQRVDPQILLERINYRPETIRAVGHQIKAHCPIHGEDKFATLLIDSRRGTVQCAARACPAHKGGSLIEFFALHQGIRSPLQAALALARFVELPLEDEVVEKIGSEFVQEGRQALEQGRLEDASEAVLQALDAMPESIEAQLLAAGLAEARGSFGEALEHAQRAADLAEGNQDYPEAIRIVTEHVLSLLPDDEETLLHLATLYEASGQTEKGREAVLQVIEARKSRGDLASIIPLLEPIVAEEPEHLDSRLTLARAYEAGEDVESSARHYLEAASLFEKEGRIPETLEVLEHIRQIAPTHWEARERILDRLLEEDRITDYVAELIDMGSAALEAKDDSRSEGFYRKALETDPEALQAQEGLVSVYQFRGDTEAVAAEALALADRYSKRKDTEGALGALVVAREARPEDSEIRGRLIDSLLESGRSDEARTEMLELGRLLLRQDEQEEAEAVLERLGELAGTDLPARLGIAEVYASAGLQEKSSEECLAVGRLLGSETRWDEAAEACRAGLVHTPKGTALRSLLAESLQALGKETEAVAEYETLIAQLLEEDNDAEAESVILSALELRPDHVGLRGELADLYLRTDRKDHALGTLRSLAEVLQALVETDLLASTCNRILELDPTDRKTRVLLGEQYAKRGMEAEAAGEFEAAGDAYREEGDLEEARRLYECVLGIDPAALGVLRKTAEVVGKAESPEQAKGHLVRVLSVLRESGEKDLLEQEYAQILNEYPEWVELRTEYADWLLEAGNREKGYVEWIQIAEFYADKKGDLEEAAGIFGRLASEEPENLEFLLGLARYEEKLGHVAESLSARKKAVEVLLREERRDEAIEVLEKSVQIAPADEDVHSRLADLYALADRGGDAADQWLEIASIRKSAGRDDAVQEAYKKALEFDPDRTEVRRELAEALEAESLVAEASEHWLALVDSLEKSGEMGQGVSVCRHVVDLDPENPKPRLRLVSLLEQVGEREDIREEFDALVALFLSLGDSEQAESCLRRMMELDAEDLSLPERLGRILEEQEKAEEACDLYLETARRHRDRGEEAMARALLVRVKTSQPERKEARKLLADVCVALKDPRAAAREYMDLTHIAFESRNPEDAEQCAERVVALAGSDWDLVIDLAQVCIRHKQKGMAVRHLSTAVDSALEKKDAAGGLRLTEEALALEDDSRALHERRVEFLRLAGRTDDAALEFRVLAELATSQQDPEAAALYYQSLLDLTPDDVGAHESLAEILQGLGDNEEAVRELARVAELRAESGNLDAALATAGRALELQPGNQALRSLRIDWSLQTGDTVQAADDLDILADRALEEERWEEAEQLLQRLLTITPDSSEAVRKLGEAARAFRPIEEVRPILQRRLDLAASTLEFDEAEAEYEAVLESDPENPDFHLSFGRFLRDHERTEPAIDHLTRAVTLWEESDSLERALEAIEEILSLSPEDWAALARQGKMLLGLFRTEEAYECFLRAGEGFLDENNPSEGVAALLQALEIKPNQEDLLLRVAQIYEDAKETSQAADLYLRVAGLREKRKDFAECIPVYQKLLVLEPEDLGLRRRLAEAHEATEDTPGAVAAWLDYAGKAYALEHTTEAVEAWEHIKTLDGECRENRRRLASAHQSLGRPEDARNELAELAGICEVAEDLEEAETLLLQAIELVPTDRALRNRLAEFYVAHDQAAKAVEALELLARECREAKDFAEAGRSLRRILELDDENLEVRTQLIEILEAEGDQEAASKETLLLADRLLDREEEERAVAALEEAIDRAGGDASRVADAAGLLQKHGLDARAVDLLLGRARTALESGWHELALELLDACLVLYPGHLEALGVRFDCQTSAGDTAGAIATCKSLARGYETAGNEDKQEQAWRNVLELDPEDIEAHEGLIDLLEDQGVSRRDDTIQAILALSGLHQSTGRIRRAADCHRRCLDLDPEQDKVREALAEMLLELDDWPSALEEYLFLAQRCLDREDLDQARRHFERVLELDSENLDALRTLIRIARDQEDSEGHVQYLTRLASIYVQGSAVGDAIQCYRDLVDFTPGHLESWERLATLLEDDSRGEEAAEAWKQLACRCEEAGDTASAIEALQRVEKLQPEDLETARHLADLFAATGDPSAPERYFRVIELERDSGDLDAAVATGKRLLDLTPESGNVHRALAGIHKQRGDTGAAAGAYSTAAACYEKSDSLAEAVAALEDLLELDPGRLEDRERLAVHLLSLDDKVRAVDQLLHLSEAYEEQGDAGSAIARCEKVLEIDPPNLEAHSRLFACSREAGNVELGVAQAEWLADFYLAHEDADQAQQFLEQGLELDPQNLMLREKLAELHASADRLDAATSQYLRLAEAALVRGETFQATHAMERARDCSPDDLEIRRNLAEIYLRQNNTARAREEFFAVARLCMDQGLVADARGTLDSLIIQSPEDLALREQIASLYEEHEIPELAVMQYVELARLRKENNDPEGVVKYAEEALRIKPKSVEAKELLVEAQVQSGNLDAAYNTYSDLADLYTQNGQLEKASACLRPMVEIRPEDPDPRRRVVDVLEQMNRPDLAMEELRELAGLYVKTEMHDEAVQSYRRILEIRPDDTRARLAYISNYRKIGPETDLVDDYARLAQAYARRGSLSEAAEAYGKALSLDPDNAANRESFIDFLLASEQVDRAREESASLSEALLESGQNREAVALLQKILQFAPEDSVLRSRLAQAHTRLNARGMALKELRLVAKSCAKQSDSQGLRRTLEQILEIDPQNVEARQELIALLEKEEETQGAAGQRLELAEVYAARGLLDLARDEYREIARRDPENVEAWDRLIAARRELGEEQELAADYCGLAATQRKRGALEKALEAYQEAIRLNPRHVHSRRGYIETCREAGKESDLAEEYLALADLLVERNEVDEAVELYKKVMELDPSNTAARKKLADTQARRAGMVPESGKGKAPSTPMPASAAEAALGLDSGAGEEALSGVTSDDSGVSSPAEGAGAPELSDLPEEEIGLEQVVANYQDILQVNPQNANVRLKLADLYDQMDRGQDALKQLLKASEIFFQKSELSMCVSTCERILERDPANAKVRERLSRAILKRDAFKALESAIHFSDQSHTESDARKKNPGDTL